MLILQFQNLIIKYLPQKEFINSKLNKDIKTDTYPEPIKKYKFDIVIDISILDRTISDSNNKNLFYKK